MIKHRENLLYIGVFLISASAGIILRSIFSR